jgi:AcrR family transcriptional regulator
VAKQVRKADPIQARALATRELLLETTSELLGEVGVERLSSNLICARAGLTPPAFYRYFKDKYAALAELGEGLMEAQNAAMAPLLAAGAATETDLRALILETIAATNAFPGGPWVLRVLRAVPALQHIRLQSHQRVAKAIATAAMPARASRAVRARLALQARLLVDMGYAAVELAFDEPDLNQDELAASAAQALAKIVADMTHAD